MLRFSKENLYKYATENPTELIAILQPILTHREELYYRYSRKTSPDELMGKDNKGRITPFEYYITKMAQGYLAGKAPSYHVNGENKYVKSFTNKIEEIRRYNDDGATFSDLMHDYLTTSAAYIYIYENNDNEIVYARFDSRQTVAVYDFSVPENLVGCIRLWSESSNKNELEIKNILEVITDSQIIRWYSDGNRFEIEEHEWGDVPVSAVEEPDGIAVYEPALSDIDIYEQLSNNLANMTQYNDNAKLLLKGYAMPEDYYVIDEDGSLHENENRKKYEDELYKSKVLTVSNDGDINWLLKDIDYSGMLGVLKLRHDIITMLTGVPNMTDEAFANADNASALGYKLYALDQYSSTADRLFRKAYLRMWEIICNRLNLKGNNFDFRDIDIVMQRNLPTDRDKSIDRAVKMKNSGLFATETCISESQVEVDPADEIKKVASEEEAEYELMTKRGIVDKDEQ